MANRFIIGKGELLTYDIPPPQMKPSKAHPYSLSDAKARLIPEIDVATIELEALPRGACPDDVAVVKVDLHPAYIAKSYFPTTFLRHAGLTPVGSRTVKIRPKKDLRKHAPKESETTQLFLAGSRSAFARLPALAQELAENTAEALQFAEFEHFTTMNPEDRLRGAASPSSRVFEVGLHLLPDRGEANLRQAFTQYARTCGFRVNADFDFPVGRMLFVAVVGEAVRLRELAKFSLVRVCQTHARPTRLAPFCTRDAPIRFVLDPDIRAAFGRAESRDT